MHTCPIVIVARALPKLEVSDLQWVVAMLTPKCFAVSGVYTYCARYEVIQDVVLCSFQEKILKTTNAFIGICSLVCSYLMQVP